MGKRWGVKGKGVSCMPLSYVHVWMKVLIHWLLTTAPHGGECPGSCYCCFTLRGRGPLNPMNRKLGSPQSWSGHFAPSRNHIEIPKLTSPRNTHYAHWAMQPPQSTHFILTSLCCRMALLSFDHISWKPLMSVVHQGFLKTRKTLFIAAYPMSSMAW